MSSEQMPEVTMTRISGVVWLVLASISILLWNVEAIIVCGFVAVISMLFDISHYLEEIRNELQAARKTKETEE